MAKISYEGRDFCEKTNYSYDIFLLYNYCLSNVTKDMQQATYNQEDKLTLNEYLYEKLITNCLLIKRRV